MTAQERVEAVTAGHNVGGEQGAKHYPELVTADAGVFLADLPYVFDDYALVFHF